MSGTIPLENQLKTGRRSLAQPKLQERSPCSWVGQKKKKKVLGWNLCLWEGVVKEEMFPCSENLLHQLGGPPGQTGRRPQTERTGFCLQGVYGCWLAGNQDRERPAPMAASYCTSQPELHAGQGC